MKTKLVLSGLAMLGAAAIAARADAVLDWNAVAGPIIFTSPTRPSAAGILDFAVLHAAIHDTVQAYQHRFESYAIDIDGAGSMDAAVAKASHDVLVQRFPSQTAALDAAYTSYLATHDPLLSPADPGVAVGQQVAAAVISLRSTDGSFPAVSEVNHGASAPGVWRSTPSYFPFPPFGPPSGAPFAIPWLATVTPFAMVSPTQFRPGPPPDLKSTQYRKDYDEVKALGRDTSTARTPAQTEMAYFWSDNFLAIWNRGLRSIAQANLTDSGDIARLFALAWIGSADGAISVWDTKHFYMYWRPITAINEGESDGNPKTIGDLTWKPFLNTPNYPDYSSGANGLTGAMTRALKLFFHNDHMTFTLTSNSAYGPAAPRTFSRFTEAADEVVEVRILHGIHFRTADLVGREQGREAARWAYKHILRPLHGQDDDGGDDDDQN
jgi:hypothetical protein